MSKKICVTILRKINLCNHFEKKKIVSTILKPKPAQPNEFDYLTSEFGAYLGPLIHAQLMKLRNQQLTAAQAQVAAALNKQSRTVITPQFVI